MEFPGSENKREKKSDSSTPLSSEEQTAINRRNRGVFDDGDPNQDLARSLATCQLAEPTIVDSQAIHTESSALQNTTDSDTDSGMEGMQQSTAFLGTPLTGASTHKLPSTPDRETKSGSGVSIVTPSPMKRPAFPNVQGALHEGDFTIVSPSPQKKGSVIQREIDVIAQQPFLERVQEHQVILEDHANQMMQKVSEINGIFPSREQKKTDSLLAACNNVKIATEILKTTVEYLKPSTDRMKGKASSEAAIKFKLGVLALHQAIEEVNSAAKDLGGDTEHGPAVLTILKKYQREAASAPALQNAFHAISFSSSTALSFSTASVKAEFRQEKLEEAQALLHQGEMLMASNEESPCDLAISIFDECQDQQVSQNLTDVGLEIDKSLLLVEAAKKHVELNLEGEESDFALLALKTANEEALKGIEQLKKILKSVSKYQESWPLDVHLILEKVNSSDQVISNKKI